MTTQAQSSSVQKEIVVEAPRERAFRVFVEQFDRIKPRDHTLLAVDLEETVLEPRAGGDVYDRGVDGSVCRWARVLAYEPPERLVLGWLNQRHLGARARSGPGERDRGALHRGDAGAHARRARAPPSRPPRRRLGRHARGRRRPQWLVDLPLALRGPVRRLSRLAPLEQLERAQHAVGQRARIAAAEDLRDQVRRPAARRAPARREQHRAAGAARGRAAAAPLHAAASAAARLERDQEAIAEECSEWRRNGSWRLSPTRSAASSRPLTSTSRSATTTPPRPTRSCPRTSTPRRTRSASTR